MTIRVALNGFGRIGRNIFRVLYERDDIHVAAICDTAAPENLVYLLKYDTLSGTFNEPIELIGDKLCAKGRLIPFVSGRAPGDVNWRDYDVDVVIEASGRYRDRESLTPHLDAGARRVVLTKAPRGEVDRTVVRGINGEGLDRSHKIVSVGSLGINALAPILQILDEAFKIEEGFYSLVHAYTNKQTLGDVYKPNDLSDLRRSRSAPENIIPASTHSPIQLERVLPQLNGRVKGMALSAAVPDGSVADLVTFHKGTVSREDVNAVVKSAAATYFKGMVEFSTEQIVSADICGKACSAVFDSIMTSVISDDNSKERRTMIKTLIWYDNGWGHAHRVVDLVDTVAKTL